MCRDVGRIGSSPATWRSAIPSRQVGNLFADLSLARGDLLHRSWYGRCCLHAGTHRKKSLLHRRGVRRRILGKPAFMNRRGRRGGPVLLLVMVASAGLNLTAWKYQSVRETRAAFANRPERVESVTVDVTKEVQHRQTATSIGTVLALRSITLRNSPTPHRVDGPNRLISREGSAVR